MIRADIANEDLEITGDVSDVLEKFALISFGIKDGMIAEGIDENEAIEMLKKAFLYGLEKDEVEQCEED
ncbi:MAG: hypothetical protein KH020_08020 [Clostridiales bacterium]|nr:hypothetical protein [Clostridiales bacterium]